MESILHILSDIPLTTLFASILAGLVIGLMLSLVGGGGSILAVPAMLYIVGMDSIHLAIGTSAFIVAFNALLNILPHIRKKRIKWRCSILFSGFGMVGAFAGAQIGKSVDGDSLILLFSALMIIVAITMIFKTQPESDGNVVLNKKNAPALSGIGLGAGMLSGFFGIGGGFLIVPGLIFATGMTITAAIASSLIGIFSFGAITAASYAYEGLIDIYVALTFLMGGFLGGIIGAVFLSVMETRKRILNNVFAGFIIIIAITMILESLNHSPF